ncbi:MAG: mechanosensitive ion channel family protein [Firmicutes bacterium]|nr:mechanosensitive ion channel family protein [Bacillota bacterium]
MLIGLYERFAAEFTPQKWQAIIMGLGRFLFTLAVVLVGGALVLRLGRSFIARVLRQPPGLKPPVDNRRLQTIESLMISGLRYTVVFIGALVVLDAAGVPVTSLIASAGLVGLAVGFGAQNLVRDVITGFFILLEDQYGVGDYVAVANVEGFVEDMGLRTTRLRDFAGDLHTIPNGEISCVTKKSRGPRRALVQVTVPYEADLMTAEKILQQVALEAKQDLAEIVEGPSVLGVTDLSNAQVTFQLIAKTKPLAEWRVERELRRRLKLALDAAGISPPYPRQIQVVTLQKEDEK